MLEHTCIIADFFRVSARNIQFTDELHIHLTRGLMTFRGTHLINERIDNLEGHRLCQLQ